MATTTKAVIARHANAPVQVQKYLEHVPSLVRDYPPEICLSYLFAQVERAHRRSLYCGVVRGHRADASMAAKAVDVHHLSRADFRQLFEVVFSSRIPATATKRIESAEKTRDKFLHGRQYSAAEMRDAIVAVIDYAEQFNDHVQTCGGFRPFGDLRGFKGRGTALDKSTTRWLLKGTGFSL